VTLTKITPGQPLTDTQRNGLQLVSLWGGGKRDVVLAIDITESVGLNDQGRIHLRQIVEDSLKPGDSVFVDIRWFGAEWYRQMNLPERDFKTYVVIFRYERFAAKKRKIVAYCPIFQDRFTLDHVFVFEFGSVKEFNNKTMVLVDAEFVAKFPELLDSSGTPVYTTK
jgi:hypothetical protein